MSWQSQARLWTSVHLRPDYKAMQVPMVDAVVLYNCPYDGKEYILVIRNALHVPSMQNNLIPPFMLREAGIEVKETPKIHVTGPTEDDHAIRFPETGFRIPLSLWGIFSYFPTSKPAKEVLVEPSEVYMLTPTVWNPHSDAYAINEESMLDWEGNMKPKKDWTRRVVLEEIPEHESMVSSLTMSQQEQAAVDDAFDYEKENRPRFQHGPAYDDGISCMVAGISATLHDATLCDLMEDRAEEGKFKMNIGSTNATSDIYVETVTEEDSDDEDSIPDACSDGDGGEQRWSARQVTP